MAKKVFIIADGKAQPKERRFSRPLGDQALDALMANPDTAEAKAKSTEAPRDPSIIARHTKNPGEVFARIKAHKFHFMLLPDDDRLLDQSSFVVIGAGQSKGKVALQWTRFADEAEYLKQVQFWQARYDIAIASENQALVQVRYLKGRCRFRWHEGHIEIGIQDLTKLYIYPETLVRQASDADLRRFATQAFARFAKRRQAKAKPVSGGVA
jgi:hypothetical protein